ncbi:MAG: energy transducer TonB [Thermodesulfobacteriota bacterium]|nr:energy transducer TonB [Thermodesulfobacteriota bacterium]
MSRHGEGLLGMESMSHIRTNWLLRGLIGISVGIHLVIFVHVSGLYRSHLLTRIELTLQDTSEQSRRNIPRPRRRTEVPELSNEIKKHTVKTHPKPDLSPMRKEPTANLLPDAIEEPGNRPVIPEVSGTAVSDWQPVHFTPSYDYKAPEDYLEMIRLRIERFKKYPHSAKARHVEGAATLRFAITREGKLKGVTLVESSRHKILDRAALGAVCEAAPFPPPPNSYSGGDLTLEITIVFELT